MADWRAIQQKLQALGYYPPPLTIDGIPGNGTRLGLALFERAKGIHTGDALDVTPQLLAALGLPPAPALVVPPWMSILAAKMGLREKQDNAELRAFLKSDGHTLGDPAVWPWCGDMAETVQLNSGYGPVPSNPYLALNWLAYGRKADACYGAIMVFRRPGPLGTEGHVGWGTGINKAGTLYRVRGGNEGNAVADVWIEVARCAGIRLPTLYKGPTSPLPILADDGGAISTNEA